MLVQILVQMVVLMVALIKPDTLCHLLGVRSFGTNLAQALPQLGRCLGNKPHIVNVFDVDDDSLLL